MYNLNVPKLIRRNLQHDLGQSPMLEWLAALLAPIVSGHSAFILYRQKSLEDLNTNGQVTKLRAGLNERFDPALKRIEIEDSDVANTLYVFLESENRPLYLPEFISGTAGDFKVLVPTELSPYESQIKAFLDRFKLPSKRYIIIYV